MIDFFSSCSDEFFYFPTEDQFIINEVKKEMLEYVIEIFENNLDSNLLRFCLAKNVEHLPHDVLSEQDGFKLIERSQNAMYRNSLHASIFHRKNLLKELKTGMSPWDFELNTGKNNGMKVLGTSGEYVLSIGHAYKRGKNIKDWHRCSNNSGVELNKEDLLKIEQNNWVPEL